MKNNENQPPKRGLYLVGFVKQQSQWLQDLARAMGSDSHDIPVRDITLRVEEQLDSDETYCDANGNVVEKNKAVCRKFNTGLCSAEVKKLYAWFNRDERNRWVGVEFKFGESMRLKDLGWLDNYDGWSNKLKELTGNDNLDVKAVEQYIVSQKGRPGTFLFYDGTPVVEQTADLMALKTGCTDKAGIPIMARFKRYYKYLWKGVDFVRESEVKIEPKEITNNDSLFCVAYMPDKQWQEELANLTRKETWGFSDSKPYSILTQYLRLTYLRLRQQDKLLVKDGKCMIFNTGLVTPFYEYIHAYFEPNKKGAYKWAWKGFGCINGTGQIVSKLQQYCPSDLPTARWFDKIEQLVFDVDKEVTFDGDHCMVQNATRLPDFLMNRVFANNRAELDEWEKFKKSIARNPNVDHDSLQAESEKKLSSYTDYEEIRRQLRKEMESAIKLAKKIVSLDYTAAVPQYYPRDGKLTFLLPLFFNKVDENPCALVVTMAENGAHYIGKTILTREMAYSNARLLRRPTVQWILPHSETQKIKHEHQASATREKSRSDSDYSSPEERERLRSRFRYTRW